MKIAIIIFCILYLYWSFPPSKESCNENDVTSAKSIVLDRDRNAAANLASGKYDSCAGLFSQWYYRATAVPQQFGIWPKETAYEVQCQSGLSLDLLVLYLGWRNLGYSSCKADNMTPIASDNPTVIHRQAKFFLQAAKQIKE